jgi:hypothetical protein
VNSILQKLKSIFGGNPPAATQNPTQLSLTPLEPTTPQSTEPPLTSSDIGYAIGAAGGGIADAAQLQYILSRVAPGRRPTADEIGKIVGMMGGSLPKAIIINALLNKK